MKINADKWAERFGIGIISIIVLIIATITLGTSLGRHFLVFVIVTVVIIMGLGWVVDVLIEAYFKYT